MLLKRMKVRNDMLWLLKKIWTGIQAIGMFVSTIINYLLLLIVYIIGVGLTWAGTRIFKKKLLDYEIEKKTFWTEVSGKNNTIERARRMF